MSGYWFTLKESADAAKQTRDAEGSWLIVPNGFEMQLTTRDSKVFARLQWDVTGKPRDYEYAVESVRADYRRLALACWNGDFELSNIRFETQ